MAEQLLMTVEHAGDALPQPLAIHADGRSLSGVCVLGLVRVIAGSVRGQTPTAHGADVLLVTTSHLPAISPLIIDTGRGKCSAQLDLRGIAGAAQLRTLLRSADIFMQGYRPDGVAALQLDPEQVAALHPGITYVSLCAYDCEGPRTNRRGFDSLAQAANGFNWAGAQAAGEVKPRPPSTQALDRGAGYLMATGAMMMLACHITEGGSWHVCASLARTAHWLRGFSRITRGFNTVNPRYEDTGVYLGTTPSGFDTPIALRHTGQFPDTPPHWTLLNVPLGAHPARW